MNSARKLIKSTLNTINASIKSNCMQYTWLCRQCTFAANPHNRFVCEMCGANREPNNSNAIADQQDIEIKSKQNSKYWMCSSCTLSNSYANDVCDACGKQRVDILINDDSPPVRTNQNARTAVSKWTCEKCTYSNSAHSDCCEMCSNQLNHQAANQTTRMDMDDSWTCPMCSYKNKTSQTKTCGICNHNRQQQQPTMTTNSLGSSVCNRQQSRKIQNGYECDETEARNTFNTIVNYCTRNRIHFVDDSFPPCDKSLFAKGTKPTAIRMIRWCTPNEIRVPSEDVGLQWSVVYNKPSFDDIRQGLLGNCWFLSALAVISESEHLLNRIMLTKVFCDIGCYQIRLCMNGEWKIVIVDDLFPCDAYARLIYSKAVKKQLWVILIEKAMAKLHGSYDALIAGHTIEGLATLTGYPCETVRLDGQIDHETVEFLWAKLLSCKEADFVFGASCGKPDLDTGEFVSRGLQRNHAYSILDVKTVGSLRFIKLRNPWGSGVWNGDWSRKSPKWTAELRRHLNYQSTSNYNNESGTFWMSYEDFCKYFCAIDICKTRLNWSETRIAGEFLSNTNHDANTMSAFNFVCFETTQIDLNVFLSNYKSRRDDTVTDIDLSCIILNVNNVNNRLSFVTASKREVKKHLAHEYIFEKGEYILVPLSFNFWSQYLNNCNYEYNLVMHSSTDIFLAKTMYPRSFISDVLIHLCIAKGAKTYYDSKALIHVYTTNWSGIIVMAENFHSGQYFEVEINADQSMNIVSSRDALNTYDLVEPLTRQILVLLTQLESTSGYNIKYAFKYRLVNRFFSNKTKHVPYISDSPNDLHRPISIQN